LELEHPRFEIIIVDNKSTNRSIDKLRIWLDRRGSCCVKKNKHVVLEGSWECLAYFEYRFLEESKLSKLDSMTNVSIIAAADNDGFAAGSNIGIRRALSNTKCDFVWVLNNDTIVGRTSLTDLLEYHESKALNSPVGIIGAKLLYYHQPSVIQAFSGYFNKWTGKVKTLGVGEEDDGQYDDFGEEVDYANGASMLVSRSFLETVGLMEESFFLYCEEIEWSHRARLLGLKTYICPKVTIYHKQGSSTHTGGRFSSEDKSLRIEKFKYSSMLRLYHLHFPRLSLIAKTRIFTIGIGKILKGHWREGVMIIALVIGLNRDD
jgi:GT2 family glycosyltransferase